MLKKMLQRVNFAMFQTIGTKEHEEAIKHEFDLLGEEVPMKHAEKIIAKCLVGRLHANATHFYFYMEVYEAREQSSFWR